MQYKIRKSFGFFRYLCWNLLRLIVPILRRMLVIGSQNVNQLSSDLRSD